MIKGILYSLIGVVLFCTTASIAEDEEPPHCHKVGASEILGCDDRYADPNYTPTSNGCSTGMNVPFYNQLFQKACNAHDICYGTCKNEKANCDSSFYSAMKAKCNTLSPNKKINCYVAANSYYNAVKSSGKPYFKNAQAEACCCPQN